MNIREFQERANHWGEKGKPFFFIIDFEMERPFLCKLDKAAELGYFYNIKGNTNQNELQPSPIKNSQIDTHPGSQTRYRKAFEFVIENLEKGNSYLLNLTFPALIRTEMALDQIFWQARAPYKLLHSDSFTIFSPESFVKTRGNKIYSYPMKGTIDASVPSAREKILENKKEKFEHNTIVDLIRNDLSMVASNITVAKYRYIDKLKTSQKDLLQVSSEIKGTLPRNWQNKIGETLVRLLPAGSISGAPKRKTVEIIQKAEQQERGYYTGIFGIFDGQNLDSAVNIRYIETTETGLQFRSGGGITALSDMEKEYQEMLEKIYVPLG